MAATNANAINYFSPAKWVVSTVSGQGTHSTITAATSAASAGDTIVLMDYVATENVAMKTGVNYTAFTGASNEPTSKVTGKWTYSSAGTVSISNIEMITNSDYLLAVTGSAASIVNLNNCYLNASNNTGIDYTSSSGSSGININNCTGDLGTTGIGIYTMSSAGGLNINYSSFTNSGSSTTNSTNSAGQVSITSSSFGSPFSTTSTGILVASWTAFSTSTNTTCITYGGLEGNINHCSVTSGSASAISIGSGLQVNNCLINSTNTNAITGAGSIAQFNTFFINTVKVNTTTQAFGGAAFGLTQGTAPTTGCLGEFITSSNSGVSISNNTGTNITSIALTAGIWNLTASGNIQFSGSSSASQLAINAVSGTITGTVGVNISQFNFSTSTAFYFMHTVPCYRVTLSSSATYYLNGLGDFSTGSCTGQGTITATRVG